MIDPHNHILPNVDDGAASDEEAIEMLRIAEDDGIRTIVATPHVPSPSGVTLAPEEILRHVAALNELARDRGIGVGVLAGSEIRCEPDIVNALQMGELLTMNGSPYVLLELPLFGDWPSHVRSTVYDLQMEGFIPILAHVERYPAVQEDLRFLVDLVATGVLMQVNASSIAPGAGGREPATARRLLEAQMVHVLGSDAHSPRRRSPRLRAAYQRVAEMTKPEYAAWIRKTSAAVVTGEVITLPEPMLDVQDPWWRRFWRRSG